MQGKKKQEKILWILYRSKDAVTKDFYQNEAMSDMLTSETLVNGKGRSKYDKKQKKQIEKDRKAKYSWYS